MAAFNFFIYSFVFQIFDDFKRGVSPTNFGNFFDTAINLKEYIKKFLKNNLSRDEGRIKYIFFFGKNNEK